MPRVFSNATIIVISRGFDIAANQYVRANENLSCAHKQNNNKWKFVVHFTQLKETNSYKLWCHFARC